MNDSDAPLNSEFTHWVEEQSEALKYELGEKFPIPPTILAADYIHPETNEQKLEEVLLGHESPTPAFLEEVAALESAEPWSDEELARQALEAGGADDDPSTPE
jgi:hypothetical protein